MKKKRNKKSKLNIWIVLILLIVLSVPIYLYRNEINSFVSEKKYKQINMEQSLKSLEDKTDKLRKKLQQSGLNQQEIDKNLHEVDSYLKDFDHYMNFRDNSRELLIKKIVISCIVGTLAFLLCFYYLPLKITKVEPKKYKDSIITGFTASVIFYLLDTIFKFIDMRYGISVLLITYIISAPVVFFLLRALVSKISSREKESSYRTEIAAGITAAYFFSLILRLSFYFLS